MQLLTFFLVTLSYLVHTAFGYGSGISSTVFSLPAYQTSNGGFSTQVMEDMPGTLDDTAHAAFLASLFGVKEKINVEAAQSFLQSVQNSDGGFSNEPGRTSDLESVRVALSASLQLGSLPADTSKVVSFVNSLYDSNAKLFKNSGGRSADLKATARALEIFQLLEYNTPELASIKSDIAAHLSSSIKNEEGRSFFSSITADNYFGILVADLTGLELTDLESWTAYFQSRQVSSGPKKGGFFSDDFATEVEVKDAAYAIHALFILGGHQPVARTGVNLQALQGFLNSLAPALATASHAYAALGRTVAFAEGFKIAPSYAVRDTKYKVVGNRIIQGSHFRANAALRTTYGLAHSGAGGSAVISHGSVVESRTLAFNAATQVYESEDYYDSTGQFGDVSIAYTMQWTVPGFERILLSFSEKKSIGYDISIATKAVYGDDEMDPGETIGVGTKFSFTVQLGTVGLPKPNLLDGEFDVLLTVLDSSNIAIHSETFDARSNTNAINFQYNLDSANLPSGRVTFRFQVKGTAGVHTTEEIWFKFNVPMVATQIDFEQEQVLHFNDKIKISVEPASLFNGEAHVYTNVGARRLFLDVHSAGGAILGSFPGQLQITSDHSVYNFDVTISPRFDWMGTHVVTFRYQDAFGNDFPLKNYDSEENELFEDALTYSVDTNLEVEEITELPEGGELAYGSEVSFSFRVKDAWSDEIVNRGGYDSTAFLAIRHTPKDGKAFTSSKVRAQHERDSTTGQFFFNINWEVDPNAVKEDGQLVLFVTDADGNEVPLNVDGEAWSVEVTIGGSLNIDQKGYSAVYDESDSVFLVSFELSSEDKKLSGAELTAKISFEKSVISVLPVAAGIEGEYQVSWTLQNNNAKTGAYVVDIFRRVDLERATSENPYDTAKPFFSVTVNHQGVVTSPLPFKTELLFVVGALVVVFVVTFKKLEIDKKN